MRRYDDLSIDDIDVLKKMLDRALKSREYYNQYLKLRESDDESLHVVAASSYDATLMNLQIFGESIKDFTNRARESHEMDWFRFNKFINLRNRISHDYDLVSPKIIDDLLKDEMLYNIEMIEKLLHRYSTIYDR